MPRNVNLDWMRKLLADLEDSRSDPRIADVMDEFAGASPKIAADMAPGIFEGSPGNDSSMHASRRTKR
jgi:hypothetical protein